VVLVENGGFGGLVAAPIAKAVYEAAFGIGPRYAQTPSPPAKEPEVLD
jgi:hypothetical protein